MGGGSSKKSSASAVVYGADTVCILGVQGAGKSTVMKQFKTDADGPFELSEAKIAATKDDILKAVAMRTRVLLQHLVDVEVDDDKADIIANYLDDISEAESDFLSSFAEAEVMSVGSQYKDIKKKPIEESVPTDARTQSQRGRGVSFVSKENLNGHLNEAFKLASLIKEIWTVEELLLLNCDEKTLFEIVDKLQSSEKEQLFMSGANFIGSPAPPNHWDYDTEEAFQAAQQKYDPDARRHDITLIVKDDYQLTRSDYCNSRSWTRDFSEAKVQVDDRTMTFRDVGGDELNRHLHWNTAIKDSFCTMFLISLSDFTKKDKMKTVREILWGYLIMEERPKIIMLLNKRDLFLKKLWLTPLHIGCPEFHHVDPKGDKESFLDYAKRCETAIIDFFNVLPSSIKDSDAYRERRKDCMFDPKALKLSAAYVTQATDSQLFATVKHDLLGVFSEQLKEMLSDAF